MELVLCATINHHYKEIKSIDKKILYKEGLFIICRYANRAKAIKNKPKINEDPKDALLREFQEEIAR